MKTNTPPERAAAVLAWLRSLKNDRGAMANLRCGLVPARRHRAWPLLARVGGIDDPIAETVAALYAYHPEETDSGNLGDTCRELAGTHNPKKSSRNWWEATGMPDCIGDVIRFEHGCRSP